MSDKTECKTVDIETIIGGILAKAATHGHSGIKISIVGELALIEIMPTRGINQGSEYDRRLPSRVSSLNKFGI